jgi:predicted ATP-grasp superfamily ATP-dependent carboligase
MVSAVNLAERIQRLKQPATTVVLDGRGLADLGVVRSLGRVGVEVWLAGPSRRALAAASRYVSRRVLMPPVEKDPKGYVDALAAWCASQSRRLILYCTGDLTTGAVSRYRCLLPGSVSHHMANSDLVNSCLSKSSFAELAADRGFPVPQSRACSDAASVQQALDELGAPVFVKPDNRHKLWTGDAEIRRAVNGIKGFVISRLDEIPPPVLTSLEHGYSWVVQQYVPGDARELISVHVYRSLSGDWTQAFVGQKLRTAPPVHGVGVLVRSRNDVEAVDLAEKLLAAADYRGYALLQFKRHTGTGELQLMEINPRYSTWCELALDAGVNLPGCAYLDHHDALDGLRSVSQRDDIYWWDVSGDFSNLPRASADWSQRLGCFRLSSRWPAFARLRLDDPRPALARFSWATRHKSWESARS